MARHPLDDRTADRLLAGRLPADDAPPGYGHVAEVVKAALIPATPSELARESPVIAMAIAARASDGVVAPAPTTRRNTVLTKLLTAKAAVAGTVLLLGAGTAAAAATGALPNQPSHPAQGQLTSSSVTGTSGTSIPRTGPANSHALFGLCTAFLAGSSTTTTSTTTGTTTTGRDGSTAFQALINETGGSPAATVTFCTNYVKTHQPGKSAAGSPGSDSGTTTPGPSEPEPGSKSSGAHGQPPTSGSTHGKSGGASGGSSSDHAPVTTPNPGGTKTADTASNGHSDQGTNTANAASGGAGAAGSANASSGGHPSGH